MKNLKQITLAVLMAASILPVSGEKAYRYRVQLSDTQGTEHTVDCPQTFLSERSIERRNRQQLPIEETDLPVSRTYLKGLTETGVGIVTTSKWNNTVVVEVTDTMLMDKVANLAFVKGIKKVWKEVFLNIQASQNQARKGKG